MSVFSKMEKDLFGRSGAAVALAAATALTACGAARQQHICPPESKTLKKGGALIVAPPFSPNGFQHAVINTGTAIEIQQLLYVDGRTQSVFSTDLLPITGIKKHFTETYDGDVSQTTITIDATQPQSPVAKIVTCPDVMDTDQYEGQISSTP